MPIAAYPFQVAVAFHVEFQILAYSVCPPVPVHGYVYILVAIIV